MLRRTAEDLEAHGISIGLGRNLEDFVRQSVNEHGPCFELLPEDGVWLIRETMIDPARHLSESEDDRPPRHKL